KLRDQLGGRPGLEGLEKAGDDPELEACQRLAHGLLFERTRLDDADVRLFSRVSLERMQRLRRENQHRSRREAADCIEQHTLLPDRAHGRAAPASPGTASRPTSATPIT